MRARPLGELQRPARHGEEVVVDARPEGPQALELVAAGRRCGPGHPDRAAVVGIPEPDGDFRGGIVPDEVVFPRTYTRFEAAMEASTSFLEFAQQYLQGHSGITEEFEVTPEMLNEFQLFLSKRYIRPDLSEWSSTLNYIRSRLKQEIINLALGVAKGDEVEAARDPQVLAALKAIGAP